MTRNGQQILMPLILMVMLTVSTMAHETQTDPPLPFAFSISGGSNAVLNPWKDRVVNFHISLFSGQVHGVDGMQIGLISNRVTGDFHGYDATGISSRIDGNFNGFQAGALSNNIGGNFIGMQSGGIYNKIGSNYFGMQSAGIVNVVGESFIGMQTGGIFNKVGGDFLGLQTSGIFNEVDGDFQLYVVSDNGQQLLDGFDKISSATPEVVEGQHFKKKIRYHYNRLPRVFQYAYHSDVWAEVASRCVGCGACTLTCPTCFCFDVTDEVEVTAEDGMRQRSWDSCMLSTFAEVAGGENFREKTINRTRHRLFRKFKYITDEEGLPWCVGCGRCTAFCPAGISMPDIVNDLIHEDEKAQYHKTVRV